MQICTKCVLDENFPGIKFDDEGVCNYCRTEKPLPKQQELKADYDNKFRALIEEHKGKGVYDALVAYSGGKDSTYTLHLLKEKYGLRVLALTFDNWFFSERAHTNIKHVVRSMGIDHINIRPAFKTYKAVINTSANNDLYSAKALQRASAICTSCISIVRFLSFQTAIDKSIPFVVFGMSPGQAPLATSIVKTNARMMRQSQEATYNALHQHVGDAIKPYFLSEAHFALEDRFPHSINPLAFNDYDEEAIIELIHQKYDWDKPDDTDPNSSNCLLNAYANEVHIQRYKINPYAYEIAGMVRNGVMDREEGLRRLKEKSSEQRIIPIKNELNS